MLITIETEVMAPRKAVWDACIDPAAIVQWNFASDDWCCPSAVLDFRNGGAFSCRMEAKDGSFGFDFEGTFGKIVPLESIELLLGDARPVVVHFIETDAGTRVVETFEAEDEHSAEMQKNGWQAIWDNFKKFVESAEME